MVDEIKTKDIIILDDPTDGFSNDQMDKIRDVVNELRAKQTIIVSHEPKIESYLDNIIKVRKDDGISRFLEVRYERGRNHE
jgi:exonuclease SbcC